MGLRGWGLKLSTYLHVVWRFTVTGARPPLPSLHMPLRHRQGQLCFLLSFRPAVFALVCEKFLELQGCNISATICIV